MNWKLPNCGLLLLGFDASVPTQDRFDFSKQLFIPSSLFRGSLGSGVVLESVLRRIAHFRNSASFHVFNVFEILRPKRLEEGIRSNKARRSVLAVKQHPSQTVLRSASWPRSTSILSHASIPP